MEQHQKNANGNSLIIRQMLDTFRMPKDFQSLVYLSLALQAEGIRYGVEHWRRHPERVAGILYWQLNDCWPVASWSSLDYFGRWKALHYAARRFFAPIMLSIEDKPPEQAVYVSNETLMPWEGLVRWFLETLDGEVLSNGETKAEIAPQSAWQVCASDFSEFISEENVRKLVFVAELWQGKRLTSRQTATFTPIKHLELAEAEISMEAREEDGMLITLLKARSLALLVEVTLRGTDAVFSDNYFNLPAGRGVEICCRMPTGWTLEQAKTALQIRSVYDSYAHGE
jgi:beta-mannosidase